MQKWAIIVAGGAGLRMQTSMPKQFIELRGKPVLMHSITAIAEACKDIRIIVVLPLLHIDYWRELCCQHEFVQLHDIVEGGNTRYHSVKRGLSTITGDGLVAVHDGVRPLVSRQTVVTCFTVAARHGCAIPVISPVDSVREVSRGGTSRMLDRSVLRMVQTPQVFDIASLKKAYEQDWQPTFTDDASVFEQAGHPVCLTEGNVENIKITTQKDLMLAEAFLQITAANNSSRFS